jgi:hypothetical protein
MSRVLEEADDAEVLVQTHSFEGATFASHLQDIAVLYQQEKLAHVSMVQRSFCFRQMNHRSKRSQLVLPEFLP